MESPSTLTVVRKRSLRKTRKEDSNNNNNNNNNNFYFKRVTPTTMKSILPSGPLKTKFTKINYNSRDKKPIQTYDDNTVEPY